MNNDEDFDWKSVPRFPSEDMLQDAIDELCRFYSREGGYMGELAGREEVLMIWYGLFRSIKRDDQ